MVLGLNSGMEWWNGKDGGMERYNARQLQAVCLYPIPQECKEYLICVNAAMVTAQ